MLLELGHYMPSRRKRKSLVSPKQQRHYVSKHAGAYQHPERVRRGPQISQITPNRKNNNKKTP
jgi:hypothetical protein